MTVIVNKIRDLDVQATLAVACRTCLFLCGLALAQAAAAFVVFSL